MRKVNLWTSFKNNLIFYNIFAIVLVFMAAFDPGFIKFPDSNFFILSIFIISIFVTSFISIFKIKKVRWKDIIYAFIISSVFMALIGIFWPWNAIDYGSVFKRAWVALVGGHLMSFVFYWFFNIIAMYLAVFIHAFQNIKLPWRK